MLKKWCEMPKRSAHPGDDIDLSQVLTTIITEIVHHTPSLSHIDVDRTLVCVGSNKSGRRGGLYGKLVPLRFENGSSLLSYRGRVYAIPEVSHNGIACLYLVYFYMPRFFNLTPDEKLRVIFHELYHISPRFDGDIRRMGAVKTAHGHSKKHFDSLYADELNSFIHRICGTEKHDFLSMDSKALFRRYSRVNGIRMKSPRPVIINT
jgi:predicted metallopeptidase